MARLKRKQPTRKPARPGYGWIPDLPDQRDVVYGALRPVPAALPPAVDWRAQCPPVENQGQLGSCTANALVGALEFLELKDRVPFADLSRLFIYYNERALEHTVRSDSGAMLRDGIKTLKAQGVCTEKKWPYDVAAFAKKPTPACYREGLDHQVTSYLRLLTLEQMQACLAEGFPFVFGFTVYESFESSAVAQSGRVELPQAGERVLGGHAVLAVGYDAGTQRFWVRNSWGSGWGVNGYFSMPFAYLGDPNLARDFWTLRRGENL